MGTFTIIENGFVTEPYQTKYGFQPIVGQNTLREVDGNKYGLIVAFSASGHPDVTSYVEIENIACDGLNVGNSEPGFPTQELINYWLQIIADQYEGI
jgi:hypothetical protein